MAVRKRRAEDGTSEFRNNVIDVQIAPRRLSVSETLKLRRMECDLDVAHVAQVLRMRPAVLEAIEDGRFDELPGPAYAVGFVRSYATYLGLDSEALVLRFKAEAAEISARPNLSFPLPISDRHVPTRPLLIICVLIAILTYAGWYYLIAKPGQLAEIVPAVPERLHHLAPAESAPKDPTGTAVGHTSETPGVATATTSSVASPPPAVAALTPPAPASTNAGDGVPPVENQPGPPVAAALPAPPDLAQPPISGDTAGAANQGVYGAPESAARIVLHAVADTWIQVRDGQSNLLFTRVLKPGERYNVPNQPGVTLIAGNAGGLDIAVDGQNVPHLGELGKVARNVSLDPDRLLGARTRAN